MESRVVCVDFLVRGYEYFNFYKIMPNCFYKNFIGLILINSV